MNWIGWIILILGFAALVEGVIILLFPSGFKKWIKNWWLELSDLKFRVIGVLTVLLGLLFIYFAVISLGL